MDCLSRQNSSLIGPKNPAKFENDCILRSVHRLKITQPSAEDALYNDVKTKIMTCLTGKVLKIRRSTFLGHAV